ncbi:MAG: NAD(P)-dependent alcohol dehydrogenase [Myxococcota bacterium]
MRAVTFGEYGPPSVLRLETVSQDPPRDGQVAVHVRAAAINPKDVLVRKGRLRWMVGRSLPRRTGYDYAGVVQSMGARVSGLAVGDRVFGMLNEQAAGAVAEGVVTSAAALAPLPESIPFVQAAAIPLAGQTALQALRDLGHVRAGHRVWIHGASGGVGTFAIQVAKILGAHVTTTSSERNTALCASLGADVTCDYRVDDPREADAAFDLIFDVFGNQSFAGCRRSLRKPGVYISTVPSLRIARDRIVTQFAARRARIVLVRSRRRDLAWLAQQCELGTLVPQVDRTFGLEEVSAAHEYIETRRARGKVVVRVD